MIFTKIIMMTSTMRKKLRIFTMIMADGKACTMSLPAKKTGSFPKRNCRNNQSYSYLI